MFFILYDCRLCWESMALGFLHKRTVLPLFRGSSSHALSTRLNGRIAQATRLQVANASHFARRVNTGKSPTEKIPGDVPQTVESWSRPASVPPQKSSWKSVVILLYLAGPCVRTSSHIENKLTRRVVDCLVHIHHFYTSQIGCKELGYPSRQERGEYTTTYRFRGGAKAQFQRNWRLGRYS